jgi:DNA-binding ferritin-like protein
MDETKKAWDEVGERFSEVGRTLSENYRKVAEERGGVTEAERQALRDTLRSVSEDIDRAFTSLGNTFRDTESRDKVQGAARALGSAILTTLDDVGEEIRKAIDARRNRPPEEG